MQTVAQVRALLAEDRTVLFVVPQMHYTKVHNLRHEKLTIATPRSLMRARGRRYDAVIVHPDVELRKEHEIELSSHGYEIPRIEVVTGILVRDSRIFLVQRLPHKEFGWMWECPGGKVEPGENLVKALARELSEEIGLHFDFEELPLGFVVSPGIHGPVARKNFDPPVVRQACRLTYYRVEVPEDFVPEMNEGIGLGWFTREEATRSTRPPGNQQLHELWKSDY